MNQTPDRKQDTVGPYRLLRVVDSDGSATVYEAIEADGGERLSVTVLAPPASSLGAGAYDDLRAAVLATAQIRHPNIIAPREVARDGPSLFIVAPRSAGETLAGYTARAGRLPPMQGLALLAQLFSALGCAERHRWVHSALHPGHLHLARNGQLKVDGSAGLAASCAPRPGRFDSPPHLAPEVRLGARPDHRADLYSAAVIAYQLLTGRLPCEADDGEPGAAAPRPVRSLRPGLPAELDDVFARALARRPQARYPCAADLWTALQAALGEPVWDRQHPPARPAGAVANVPRGGSPVRLPAIADPVVADDAGFAAPLSRRTAVGLLVGCTALAFWAADLWKAERVQQSGAGITAAQVIHTLESMERSPTAEGPVGGVAPVPLPLPAAATSDTAASAAAHDGAPSASPRPQHTSPAQGKGGSEEAPGARQRPRPPVLAHPQPPPRARLRAGPDPGRDGQRQAKAASPDLQCRSHEGFAREMCTVLRCATAEFRRHPACVRLHREAEARLQLAESRGAP